VTAAETIDLADSTSSDAEVSCAKMKKGHEVDEDMVVRMADSAPVESEESCAKMPAEGDSHNKIKKAKRKANSRSEPTDEESQKKRAPFDIEKGWNDGFERW